jgi:hypothetical protein
MAMTIPPKPPTFQGNPDDADYAQKLQEHQNSMMMWQMTVQAAQNEQNQETTMASNIQKANHEALMNISRNVAG